jgi:hypothetical protein
MKGLCAEVAQEREQCLAQRSPGEYGVEQRVEVVADGHDGLARGDFINVEDHPERNAFFKAPRN